jgi:hypothetical protein
MDRGVAAQLALFAVDPVTGNSLGFEPNRLLTPKDAFEVSRSRRGLPCN